LPIEHFGLLFRTIAPAVQPNLRQEQRALAGEVLQPREIRFERLRFLEVHVETKKVRERQAQIFR